MPQHKLKPIYLRVCYQPRTRQGGPMPMPPITGTMLLLGPDILQPGHYRMFDGTMVYSVPVTELWEVEK